MQRKMLKVAGVEQPVPHTLLPIGVSCFLLMGCTLSMALVISGMQNAEKDSPSKELKSAASGGVCKI